MITDHGFLSRGHFFIQNCRKLEGYSVVVFSGGGVGGSNMHEESLFLQIV